MVNFIATMSRLQTLQNKIGEIDFRKKLVEQLKNDIPLMTALPTKKEYLTLLNNRVKDARPIFRKLKKRGILLSPFLEIGAERGQHSMLLVNEFGADGFMTDISYDSLASGPMLKKSLGFKKMPIKICCDAYSLPFKTGCIPFVFCFQTLHHFPDPLPILKELKRVLIPGGYLYFNEEPVKQFLNLNLWRRDYHLRWFEKILKGLIVLHFISRIGRSEVENDILEETFTLGTWEKALNLFPTVEAYLKVFPFGPTIQRNKNSNTHWLTPPLLQNSILQILGGGIEALCQKKVDRYKLKYNTLYDLLACPNCPHKPKLISNNNGSLLCNVCGASYKNRNGVLMLFSKKQEKKLYPTLKKKN